MDRAHSVGGAVSVSPRPAGDQYSPVHSSHSPRADIDDAHAVDERLGPFAEAVVGETVEQAHRRRSAGERQQHADEEELDRQVLAALERRDAEVEKPHQLREQQRERLRRDDGVPAHGAVDEEHVEHVARAAHRDLQDHRDEAAQQRHAALGDVGPPFLRQHVAQERRQPEPQIDDGLGGHEHDHQHHGHARHRAGDVAERDRPVDVLAPQARAPRARREHQRREHRHRRADGHEVQQHRKNDLPARHAENARQESAREGRRRDAEAGEQGNHCVRASSPSRQARERPPLIS